MKIPTWVKEACFYQIFPDRFAKSENSNKLLNLEDWDSEPTSFGFKGGDLFGVAQKLDYFVELGITALYLTPIFSSTANHRYHTFDYFSVDPILGGNDALKKLIDSAHAKDIKIVLDGVFNHASRGFYQFNHTLENGLKSPYIDWFKFNMEWLEQNKNPSPYESKISQDGKKDYGYECWWNLPALPKFNTANRAVREYIFSVAKYWIDFGIDGWRLDVPYEIDDDDFWREFRNVVKNSNPDAYIVGEIWEDARRWLKGDQFDAVMNYHLGKPILTYFLEDSISEASLKNSNYEFNLKRTITGNDFEERIKEALYLYDPQITNAQMNLLTSHDTGRIMSIASDNVENVKLAFAFMYFCPGAPCLYYGDEIGLTGFQDPYCRKSFPWDSQKWNMDLLNFFKDLIKIRKKNKVLHDGTLNCLKMQDNLSVWARENDTNSFVFAFNRGNSNGTIKCTYKNREIIFELGKKSFKWKIF